MHAWLLFSVKPCSWIVINLTSCMFHTEQHPPYGVHTVLSGIRKLIFAVSTVRFKYHDVSISVVYACECTLASIFHAKC